MFLKTKETKHKSHHLLLFSAVSAVSALKNRANTSFSASGFRQVRGADERLQVRVDEWAARNPEPHARAASPQFS